MHPVRRHRLHLLRAAPLVAVVTMALPLAAQPPARGVQSLSRDVVHPFDPEESAGLFVGIRDFRMNWDGTGLTPVSYAVDDAVDLAYLFAIELGLVKPERVQLLISGDPEKQSSKENLRSLVAKGAKKFSSGLSDIFGQLHQQSKAAGPKGLLIITFATHGIREDRNDYLLTSDSIEPFLKETALDFDVIFDEVSKAQASRRIILSDACREVMRPDSRGPSQDPRFSMSQHLAQTISDSEGYVILTAARAGGYAFSDSKRGNGVFTAAVLDALLCRTKVGSQGRIKAGDLAESVNQQVAEWVKQHKPGNPQGGIEYSLGGEGAKMVLSTCSFTHSSPSISLPNSSPSGRGPAPVIPVPSIENNLCKGAQLLSVEIYLGSQGVRRMAPSQNVLSLKAETLGDLQNLTGRAILSWDKEILSSCPCRWQQFDPQTERWTELEQGGGCSFSMAPPRRQTSLRLTLGDRTLSSVLLDVQ